MTSSGAYKSFCAELKDSMSTALLYADQAPADGILRKWQIFVGVLFRFVRVRVSNGTGREEQSKEAGGSVGTKEPVEKGGNREGFGNTCSGSGGRNGKGRRESGKRDGEGRL